MIPDTEFRSVTKTLQTIVFALAVGIVAMAAAMLVIKPQAQQPNQLLGYIMAALVINVVAAPFVTASLAASSRRQLAGPRSSGSVRSDASQAADLRQRWSLVFQTKTIITCALLEGAAIANIIGYFMSDMKLNLAIAAAMLLGVLTQFPTERRIADWVQRQMDLAIQEQLLR